MIQPQRGISENIVAHPTEEKYRKINYKGKSFVPVVSCKEALPFLRNLGFEVRDDKLFFAKNTPIAPLQELINYFENPSSTPNL